MDESPDHDWCLIMMVPCKNVKVHPAIANVYKRLRIWAPLGPEGDRFAWDVKNCNDFAQVMQVELDLDGCRRLMKGRVVLIILNK